jgi:hypothetical protein
MLGLLTFQPGRIGRIPYVISSCALVLLYYALTTYSVIVGGYVSDTGIFFWFMPLRSIFYAHVMPDWVPLAVIALFLVIGWELAALAFRRALDTGAAPILVLGAIVPFVQIGVIAALSVMPSKPGYEPPRSDNPEGMTEIDWVTAVQGLLAGVMLLVGAVAFSTLVCGAYGNGLFLLTPFMIGTVTSFLANRRAPISLGKTLVIAAAAGALGSAALILVALEGVICIMLAALPGAVMLGIGAIFGRAVALTSRGAWKQIFASLVILPITFSAEAWFRPTSYFDTRERISIAAPPRIVWQSILHTGVIDEPLALPYRLGVAYPMSGDVEGEDEGATRFGKFSTGTALERVTRFLPNQTLEFTILRDIPAMHELSPYAHVAAPHVEGYFQTTITEFDLTALADGNTELVVHSSHRLRLDPVLYWLPIARWVIRENNLLVLAHAKHQSERAYRDESLQLTRN